MVIRVDVTVAACSLCFVIIVCVVERRGFDVVFEEGALGIIVVDGEG